MIEIKKQGRGNVFKKIMLGTFVLAAGAGAGIGAGYGLWHKGSGYSGKYGVSGGTNHIVGLYTRPDYVPNSYYVVSDDHTIDAITWGIRSDEAAGETRDIPKQVHINDSGRIYWDAALDEPILNFKMFVVAFIWHGNEEKEAYSEQVLVDFYDTDGDDTRYEDNTTTSSYVLDGSTFDEGIDTADYEKLWDVASDNLGTRPTTYTNPNTSTALTKECVYNDLALFVTGNIIDNSYICTETQMTSVNFYKFYNQTVTDGEFTTWDSTEGSARMNYCFNLSSTLNLAQYKEGITDEISMNSGSATKWYVQYRLAHSTQQNKNVWYMDFYEEGHKNDEVSWAHKLLLSYYYANMPGPDGI